MKIQLGLGPLALALASAACGFPKSGDVPPPPSPAEVQLASARWPESPPNTLADGRATFVAKCNNCHGYPDVTAIADDRWPEILEKMGHKAKLDANQTKAVLEFVLTSRASQHGEPSEPGAHHE